MKKNDTKIKKYNFNFVNISGIAATILYAVLFFSIPLYGFISAYLVLLYFLFVLIGSIELILKKPSIQLSKEESKTIIYLKENKYDLMAILGTGTLMFDKIVDSKIPAENVSVLLFDSSNEDVMNDVEEFTQILNDKYKI